MTQPHLNMPVSQRTVLIDVNTAMAAKGYDADTIYAGVDRGDWRWVWDVSSRRGEIRELRLWVGEVVGLRRFAAGSTHWLSPEQLRDWSFQEVLDLIVPPSRAWFRGGELCQLLMVRRPTLKALAGELRGVLVDRALKVQRADLVRFFRARWVGQHLLKKEVA